LSYSSRSSAKQVDGFSSPESSRPGKRPGLFVRLYKNNGSGKPGKPDGNVDNQDEDGIPRYPSPESVEQTESRLQHIEKQLNRLKKVVDSEDEENRCLIPEIKIGIAHDGSLIKIEASQVRDKALHIVDFLDAKVLNGEFDVTEAENLNYPARLKYLRNKKNLSDEMVDQA
jgi:hypothetical protein